MVDKIFSLLIKNALHVGSNSLPWIENKFIKEAHKEWERFSQVYLDGICCREAEVLLQQKIPNRITNDWYFL